jgi:hypothetical protein
MTSRAAPRMEEPSPKRHRTNGAPPGVCFSMGLSTHHVPMSMYAASRAKVVKAMQEAGGSLLKPLCSTVVRCATERCAAEHRQGDPWGLDGAVPSWVQLLSRCLVSA